MLVNVNSMSNGQISVLQKRYDETGNKDKSYDY